MISQHDIDNIDSIMQGEGDWFSAHLLRLIAKADLTVRERFRIGFPVHVALYEAWYYKSDSYPYPTREGY